MRASRTVLFPWGPYNSGSNAIQETTADIDLGQPTNFIAWVSVGYIGGRVGGAATSGPWDFDNAVAAEVFGIDGVALGELDAFWSRFGPPNAFENYHSASTMGFGQVITFRMRIWQPEEMEAIATGIVLSDF